jgi:ABC-2 type transport system permease protein
MNEISDAFRSHEFWYYGGLHDVRQRYRRSVIGPFWLTLLMAAQLAGISLLFSHIMKQETASYVPYLAAGFVTWAFISGCLIESGSVFIASASAIKNIRMPLLNFVLRHIWFHLIVLAHNAIVLVIVGVLFRTYLTPSLGWLLVGLPLLVINIVWMTVALAYLSARFRDIPMIVGALMSFTFMITPIFWRVDQLPERYPLVHFNPFFHLLELVRGPLLGTGLDRESLLFCAVLALLGWAFAAFLFGRARRNVPFWV